MSECSLRRTQDADLETRSRIEDLASKVSQLWSYRQCSGERDRKRASLPKTSLQKH